MSDERLDEMERRLADLEQQMDDAGRWVRIVEHRLDRHIEATTAPPYDHPHFPGGVVIVSTLEGYRPPVASFIEDGTTYKRPNTPPAAPEPEGEAAKWEAVADRTGIGPKSARAVRDACVDLGLARPAVPLVVPDDVHTVTIAQGESPDELPWAAFLSSERTGVIAGYGSTPDEAYKAALAAAEGGGRE